MVYKSNLAKTNAAERFKEYIGAAARQQHVVVTQTLDFGTYFERAHGNK